MPVQIIVCPNCSLEAEAGDRFCPHCGYSRPQGATRADETPSALRITAPGGRDRLLERVRHATAGRYDVIEMLGRGGMAAVYLATDLRLGRKVAIKVMLPHLELADGMTAKFWAEAKATARMNHPNIVVVHDVEECDDLLMFVMGLVHGATLEQVVPFLPSVGTAGVRRLPFSIVQWLLLQVAAGLEYAHSEMIVHRDIKPSNVMITVRGEVVISDFGIAKVTEDVAHTKSSLLMGTPTYMSPEQCKGQAVSGASDQYSLGIMAYELISGQPPFLGTVYDVQRSHVEKTPIPLRTRRPDTPPSLAAAVMRMIAKLPSDRFPSMSDASEALGANMSATDTSPRKLLGEAARTAREIGGRPATGGTPPPPTPMIASISLHAPERARVGESFNVVATARDASGVVQYGAAVSVESSTPSVLVVGAETAVPEGGAEQAGRVVSAVAVGTGLLVATCNGLRHEKAVVVSGARTRSKGEKRDDGNGGRTTPVLVAGGKKNATLVGALIGVTVAAAIAVIAFVVLSKSKSRVEIEAMLSPSVMESVAGQQYTLGERRFQAVFTKTPAQNPTSELREGRLTVSGGNARVRQTDWDVGSTDFVAHFDIAYEGGDPEFGGGIFLATAGSSEDYVLLLRSSDPPAYTWFRAGQEAPRPVATAALKQGTNTVDVIAGGERVTVFVNGDSVATFMGVAERTGRVGFVVGPGERYSFGSLVTAALSKR